MKKKRQRTAHAAATLPRFVDMNEISAATGISRRHIYALILSGNFPRPLKLAKRRTAFRESDVVAWIASRPEAPWAAA